ncbi:apolipoprotein D-like [Cloeon dipterum]|uniref:apolipoprotein D-like n=1 Tax=Cloeon dipterum TaxID=197152 RepID=UPI0032202413
MKFLVLLFCVLAVVAAGKNKNKAFVRKCPKVFGKTPFDQQKFAGLWHMISYMETELTEEKCARMNVTVKTTEDGATILDYQLPHKTLDGSLKTDEVYSVAEKGKTAESFAVFKQEGGQWSDPYKKYIVATDYNTYAITISCKTIFNEEKMKMDRSMCAHVYSRNTTLPQQTLEILHNIMSSYDIDTASMKIMDHSNCQ